MPVTPEPRLSDSTVIANARSTPDGKAIAHAPAREPVRMALPLRAATAGDVGKLLLAAALWGSSFLCIAIALKGFEPVAIAGYRIGLAAAVLLPICWMRGLAWPSDRRSLLLFAAIGFLNGALPFSLIGWGQLHVDSGTTAILIASSPFATLLLAHMMTEDDRFSLTKLFGLMVGFSGVIVLLHRGLTDGGGSLSGMLAIVLAAWCYAFSALLIRKLPGTPALLLVTGQLCASTLLLLPVLLFVHPPWRIEADAHAWAAVVFLALGPTAFAYVLRTRIVQTNGAVFMSNVGYLIPLFAMAWAWLFLGETPDSSGWLALALIVAGLIIGRVASSRQAANVAPRASVSSESGGR